jgi:hypothetical protein
LFRANQNDCVNERGVNDPCFPRLQRGPAAQVVVDRRRSLAKDGKVADRRLHRPLSFAALIAVTVGFAVTTPLQLFQEQEQPFRQGPRQLILRPDSLAELRPNGAESS